MTAPMQVRTLPGHPSLPCTPLHPCIGSICITTGTAVFDQLGSESCGQFNRICRQGAERIGALWYLAGARLLHLDGNLDRADFDALLIVATTVEEKRRKS